MSEYRQKLKEYNIGAEAFTAIATAGTGIGLATGDSAAIGWEIIRIRCCGGPRLHSRVRAR